MHRIVSSISKLNRQTFNLYEAGGIAITPDGMMDFAELSEVEKRTLAGKFIKPVNFDKAAGYAVISEIQVSAEGCLLRTKGYLSPAAAKYAGCVIDQMRAHNHQQCVLPYYTNSQPDIWRLGDVRLKMSELPGILDAKLCGDRLLYVLRDDPNRLVAAIFRKMLESRSLNVDCRTVLELPKPIRGLGRYSPKLHTIPVTYGRYGKVATLDMQSGKAALHAIKAGANQIYCGRFRLCHNHDFAMDIFAGPRKISFFAPR